MTTVSQNENSLQNFANVLDGLKLHQTAKALRYELEKTSQINQFESKLSKNPIINNLIAKLSTKEKKKNQVISSGQLKLSVGQSALIRSHASCASIRVPFIRALRLMVPCSSGVWLSSSACPTPLCTLAVSLVFDMS